MTSFIGRDRHLELLRSELAQHRAVTLLGPGGVGKTRLAGVLARSVDAWFPDGIFTVDVKDVRRPHELATRIAEALSVPDIRGGDRDRVGAYTESLQILIILDQCETLDDACSEWLTDLLEQTHELKLVMTSRRVVGMHGGSTLALPPMPLPDEHQPTTLSAAQHSDAVRLFVDRARLVAADFELTDDNHATVVDLCRRLDGLPLAIELAAAWARALTVHEILDRVDENAGILGVRSEASGLRSDHLRRLAAYSFELCTEEERVLWMGLSVFEGSFDVRAAEAVCGGSCGARQAVLGLLASLVDQSIVVVDARGPTTRYRLLALMREFGFAALRDSGRLAAVQDAHVRWFCEWLRSGTAKWLGTEQHAWVQRLNVDYRNVLAAVRFGAAQPRTLDIALEMASDLWFFWVVTGRIAEGHGILETTLTAASVNEGQPMRARALLTAAYLCVLQGRPSEAERLTRTAETDTASEAAFAMHVRGMIEMARGRTAAASDALAEALSSYRASGGTREQILALDALALATFVSAVSGDHESARRYEQQGLALCDEHRDQLWRGYIAYGATLDLFIDGRIDDAARRARDAFRATSDELLLAHCLELLTWCVLRQQEPERAATLFGAVDRMWHRLGGRLSGFEALLPFREDAYEQCRHLLGAEAFAVAYGRGAALSRAETHACALSDAPAPRAAASSEPRLTRRERQVAELVAKGMTNREIAGALTISRRTAESHLDHILTKLGMTNRVQLAAWIVSNPQAPTNASS